MARPIIVDRVSGQNSGHNFPADYPPCRRLRKELEELTDHGLLMLKSLQRPEANVMQRLAVQVLCKQLDQAWTYFNRSWKMQDHVYVQYLELNTFQIRSGYANEELFA